MSIYTKTRTKVNYRRIYEQHFGPIPIEPNGRSYEIHHIDGDSHNNDIANLKAVTIQEHHDIHYSQGDYYEAMLIAQKMKLSPEEISKLAKLNAAKQIKAGTHPFQDPEAQRQRALTQVANGTHPFLGGEIQRKSNLNRVANGINPIIETNKKMLNDGTHPWMKRPDGSSLSSDRVNDGSHNLLGPSSNQRRLELGIHSSQMKISCLCCKKTVAPGMFKRWHGDKCKQS